MNLDRYDLVVALILIGFLASTINAMSTLSITNDELAHISAGYSYIKTGDYRMNAEHPPLMKLLSGLALVPLNPKLPLEHPAWAARKEWIFGDRFFYQANTNADEILYWARVPIACIGALLVFFVYLWARQLYGPTAGILAAVLTALDPLIRAMSELVHTDIGITTFGFITVYLFWRFTHHRTWRNLGFCALALGLALASKFTGLYFIGIIGILALITVRYESLDKPVGEAIQTNRAKNLYMYVAIIAVLGLLTLALTYHFTQLNWFIHGMKDVTAHSTTGHRSFLHGSFSDTGFFLYFPIAFLVKTPLASILLIALAVMLFRQTRSEKLLDEWFLIVPALVYLALFMVNRINIGVRHILPIYPFLFVFASKSVRWKSKAMPVVIGVLVLWLSWSAYAHYPHELSYFNEAIGGPEHGHEWLIDSNIDWGQDLKALGKWSAEHGNPLMLMAYFGNADRDYYNITWDELKCGPQPGLIAISANRLVGFDEQDAKCSAWLRGKEPLAKIGYSIFIYNISQESILGELQIHCEQKCAEKCHNEKQTYVLARYEEKCKCTCSGDAKPSAQEKQAEKTPVSPQKSMVRK